MKNAFRNVRNIINYFFRPDIVIKKNCLVSRSSFEGLNKIYENTVFINSKIGKGSYIGKFGNFNKVVIGRYCSIGNRVSVVSSTHPSETFVSTHPAFFSIAKQAGFSYVSEQKCVEHVYYDEKLQISAVVGSDVWIGDDVMILGGVKIGDGAIIGSRALVTKDVLPYSIVGGIPAREIRKRFDVNKIDNLLKIKWWERNDEWIKKNINLFSNVNNFLANTNSEAE